MPAPRIQRRRARAPATQRRGGPCPRRRWVTPPHSSARADLGTRLGQDRRHRPQGPASDRLVVRVRRLVRADDGVSVRGHVPVLQGRRHLGHQHAGGVGLRHRQLRLVDRHRPRGHVHLGHPAARLPEVAQFHQPLHGGDDAFRRGVRGHVPALAPGPAVGRLLALPYPNTMGLWPQWRSPLVWDVFAVSTYFTVSLLFWYVGLIPDLATLRDRSTNAGNRCFSASARWVGAGRRSTGSVTR